MQKQLALPSANDIALLKEYTTYVKILALYKREKKEFPEFQALGYQNSVNPAQRLEFYERKAQNTAVCKAFYAALTSYKAAYARQLPQTLSELAENCPTTTEQLIEHARQRAIENSPCFQQEREAAIAYQTARSAGKTLAKIMQEQQELRSGSLLLLAQESVSGNKEKHKEAEVETFVDFEEFFGEPERSSKHEKRKETQEPLVIG